MTVTVKKVDGGSVTVSGASFRRIQAIKANLRRGYQVEMMPYPNTAGKWLVRVVKPKNGNVTSAEVDSYFEVIAKSQAEAEAFIKKDGLWGGALAERVAKKIGDRGEAHFVSMLRPGKVLRDDVTGKSLEFDLVKQFRNASDNGLDVLGRLAKDAVPDPPPYAGDIFSFEVKSTLGAVDDAPRLSKAQRDPKEFNRSRLNAAKSGTGSYPALSPADKNFIDDALDAIEDGTITYRKVDMRMDHSGAFLSVNGKKPVEIKEW